MCTLPGKKSKDLLHTWKNFLGQRCKPTIHSPMWKKDKKKQTKKQTVKKTQNKQTNNKKTTPPPKKKKKKENVVHASIILRI